MDKIYVSKKLFDLVLSDIAKNKCNNFSEYHYFFYYFVLITQNHQNFTVTLSAVEQSLMPGDKLIQQNCH